MGKGKEGTDWENQSISARRLTSNQLVVRPESWIKKDPKSMRRLGGGAGGSVRGVHCWWAGQWACGHIFPT